MKTPRKLFASVRRNAPLPLVALREGEFLRWSVETPHPQSQGMKCWKRIPEYGPEYDFFTSSTARTAPKDDTVSDDALSPLARDSYFLRLGFLRSLRRTAGCYRSIVARFSTVAGLEFFGRMLGPVSRNLLGCEEPTSDCPPGQELSSTNSPGPAFGRNRANRTGYGLGRRKHACGIAIRQHLFSP